MGWLTSANSNTSERRTPPETWECLSTEEKLDVLRRDIEGIKQVLTALARRVDEIASALKASAPKT